MQLKQISTLILGLLPTIYAVAFGHEQDLIKVAELLEGTAEDLRTIGTNPVTSPETK